MSGTLRAARYAVGGALVFLGAWALGHLIPEELLPRPLPGPGAGEAGRAVLARVQATGLLLFGLCLIAVAAFRGSSARAWRGVALIGWAAAAAGEAATLVPWIGQAPGFGGLTSIAFLLSKAGSLLGTIGFPFAWGAVLVRREDPEAAPAAARLGGAALVGSCIIGVLGQIVATGRLVGGLGASFLGGGASLVLGGLTLSHLLKGWIGFQLLKVGRDPDETRRRAVRIHRWILAWIILVAGGAFGIALLFGGMKGGSADVHVWAWLWSSGAALGTIAGLAIAQSEVFRRPGGPDGDTLAVR